MKKIYIIVFLISFLMIYSESAESKQGKAGTKSAEFITLGFGSRPLSMSGAYTAVDDDIFSAFWNPAGLASLKNMQIALMHNSLPEDISQEYVSLGIPIKNSNSKYNPYIALTLNFGKYGDESVTTYSKPYGTGSTFDGSDLMVELSFANKLNDKLLAGINGKFIKQELYNYDGTAFAVDLGMIMKMNDNLSLGAGVFNIGSKIKFINENEEIPLQLKTGISLKISDYLLTNGDIIYTKDQNFDMAVGFELKFLKMLAARAGFNTVNEAGSGLTLGLGLSFDKLNFDYTYEPYGDFNSSHKVSIDYAFGETVKKDRPLKNIIDELAKKPAQRSNRIEDLIKEGYLYILDGNYFSAMFKFNEAVKLDKFNVSARLWLAYTHTRLGNKKAAISEYERVLQLDPLNSNAIQALRILKRK
ncbi:PorV/PorQ family protein [Candidatus Dependentiae bacterium]|nr:PorV/PorQ family protein [Candidatus Dependentiae bacterium]